MILFTKATKLCYRSPSMMKLSSAYAGSHAGQDAVKRSIRAHFWFPGLENAVQRCLATCHECQIHTRSPFKVPLTSTPIPDHTWDSVSLDMFGPLPDKSHILVSRCNLSWFPDAKVVRSTSAQQVLPALAATYNNFGNPFSTRPAMAHHSIVRNSGIFLRHEGYRKSTFTLTTHKEMKLNAS